MQIIVETFGAMLQKRNIGMDLQHENVKDVTK